MKAHLTNTDNPIDFPMHTNVYELADMIEFDAPIVGINKEAAFMLRKLQAECDRLYRIIELNEAMK